MAYGKWHANLSCDRYTLASIQCSEICSAEDSKIVYEQRAEFVISFCSECNVNLSKTCATKMTQSVNAFLEILISSSPLLLDSTNSELQHAETEEMWERSKGVLETGDPSSRGNVRRERCFS